MHKSHALFATKLRRLLWHEATTLTNITAEGSLIGFCLSFAFIFRAMQRSNEFLIMEIWRKSQTFISSPAINSHLWSYKFQYEDINALIAFLVSAREMRNGFIRYSNLLGNQIREHPTTRLSTQFDLHKLVLVFWFGLQCVYYAKSEFPTGEGRQEAHKWLENKMWDGVRKKCR